MAVQRSPKRFSIIEIKPEIASSEEIKAKSQNKEETKHGVTITPKNQRLINIDKNFYVIKKEPGKPKEYL